MDPICTNKTFSLILQSVFSGFLMVRRFEASKVLRCRKMKNGLLGREFKKENLKKLDEIHTLGEVRLRWMDSFVILDYFIILKSTFGEKSTRCCKIERTQNWKITSDQLMPATFQVLQIRLEWWLDCCSNDEQARRKCQ